MFRQRTTRSVTRRRCNTGARPFVGCRVVGTRRPQRVSLLPGANRNDAALFDGLPRIDRQVQENLAQLAAVTDDRRNLSVLPDDFRLILQLVTGDVDRLVQRVVDAFLRDV